MSEAAKLVHAQLNLVGLIVHGVVALDDETYTMANGVVARSAMLIGHAGSAHWTHFRKWQNKQSHLSANPLDDWSKAVITPIAQAAQGHAVFPSDKPFLPFQSWAMQAQGLQPSPLGMLIHPTYGLWHAYRGAILFAERIDEEPVLKLSHPCDNCDAKPCLNACPVNAFSKNGFDVAACRNYLETAPARACRENGCIARLACPIGKAFEYEVDQMQFHMAAFAR